MPQFDPAVWPTQLVWLAITFIALLLLMSRVVLPRFNDVFEEREQRINGNLRKAEQLRSDAEAAAASYEAMLTAARAEAQAIVRAAREKVAAEAAARHAELEKTLQQQIAAAEARIAEARREAVSGVRDIAVDIAGAAVERLTGIKVDAKAAARAVDSVRTEVIQ